MTVGLMDLYRDMALARAFELALAELWQAGRISGEMHLGTGEEAIAAGIVAHLRQGDAVALDHRPTPVLTLIGVDLVAMLREMLGREDGLCRGRGGHMHLFSPEHLAASSGIVGSSGPLAAGFALAAKHLRPGSVAVAFFGDGAVNQGMLLESFNLAAAWTLPLLFVCKDNKWAITTKSAAVTAGNLLQRAAGFGLVAEEVDGMDAMAVWQAAQSAIGRARRGKGPSFLLARCSRLDGHLLGDALVRAAQAPSREDTQDMRKLLSAAVTRGGGGVTARAKSLLGMMRLVGQVRGDRRDTRRDPLVAARNALKGRQEEVERIEHEIAEKVAEAVERALAEEE
jgi:pyruvate dehydrogenase E1 component alpha subunit